MTQAGQTRYVPPDNRTLPAGSERRDRLLVQMQTVSACNGRCVFCPYPESWAHAHPGTMSDALYRKIVADIKALGEPVGRFCPYLQNEPLLDPRLVERIGHARDELQPDLIEISTNAASLSAPLLGELADVLAGVPHEIWVSFHGTDKAMFEETTGLPYDQVVANILALLDVAGRRGLKVVIRGSGFSRYETEAHPYRFDRGQFREFWARLAREHGVTGAFDVKFVPYHDRSGGIRRASGYDYGLRRPSLAGFYCWRVEQGLHVLYDGTVVLCCNDYRKEVVLGNLETCTVRELRASEPCRRARDMALGRRASPPDFICKRCAWPGG